MRRGFTFWGNGNSTIDQVWINALAINLVVDFVVLGGGTSYHLPIKVLLNTSLEKKEEEGGVQTSPVSKIKWDFNKAEEYANSLSMRTVIVSESSEVESISEFLIHSIQTTAAELGMSVRSGAPGMGCVNNKPWFDSECRRVRKVVSQRYRAWKRTKIPFYESEFGWWRKKYANIIKLRKKENTLAIQGALSNVRDPEAFWRTYKSLKQKIYRPCPIPGAEWVNFYKKMLPPRDELPLTFPERYVQSLDAAITCEELNEVLRQGKSIKAPGPDGISTEFYKALPQEWRNVLRILFNKVLATSEIPASWGKFEIIMFYKKGETGDPLNYRGIALANTAAKIFTTLIAKRLNLWGEQNRILPEAQAGFRAKRSRDDNIFTLRARIGLELAKPKGKLFAAFVDFRRAFDSVVHGTLWLKLWDMGVSSRIIAVLQSYYRAASFRVRTGRGIRSEEIESTQGVLQGDPASPILFSLLLADIDRFFVAEGHQKINEKIELLLFADDLIMMADDVIELQRKLDILEKYCDKNKLEVNTAKTQVMVFQKAGPMKKLRTLRYNGTPLRVVSNYTYLGVPFVRSGLYNVATRHFSTKAKVALGTI